MKMTMTIQYDEDGELGSKSALWEPDTLPSNPARVLRSEKDVSRSV